MFWALPGALKDTVAVWDVDVLGMAGEPTQSQLKPLQPTLCGKTSRDKAALP